MAVIPGRGPLIAAATTSLAAQLLQQRRIQSVYVSGDAVSTAEQLVRLLGVSPARVAGDSCARTTWENAARTARWLRREAPSSAAIPPVLLITDPWQLPRATRALQRQGLTLLPVAATPVLPPAARNRLALREAAGTLLYALQGRL